MWLGLGEMGREALRVFDSMGLDDSIASVIDAYATVKNSPERCSVRFFNCYFKDFVLLCIIPGFRILRVVLEKIMNSS